MNTDSKQNFAPERGVTPPSSGIFMPLLAAAITGLVVAGMLLFMDSSARESSSRAMAARSLEAARSSLASNWKYGAELASMVAGQLAGADASRVDTVLRQVKSVWPHVGFAVYDKQGEPFVLSSSGDSPVLEAPPVPHTVRGIVLRSLVGSAQPGMTQVRGFVALSTSAPVSGSEAGALVVSVPLDGDTLRGIKHVAGVDLAVLPFLGVNRDVVDVSAAAGTFAGMPGNASSGQSGAQEGAWAAIVKRFDGSTVQAEEVFSLPGAPGCFAAAPLTGPDGSTLGALIVAGDVPPGGMDNIMLLSVALLAALLAGTAAALIARKRSEELSLAYAGALTFVADSEAHGALAKNFWRAWPESAQEAFGHVASLLRRYRERANEAERRRIAECEVPLRSDAPPVADHTSGRTDFLRLFAASPTGLFHADAQGRFIRVNQTFAELLGYDSPARLIAEKPLFGEFFLYGEDIINPLPDFVSNGRGGRIVNLRGRDGKVKSYKIVVSAITAPSGEDTGIYECFLQGRDMEESAALSRRERDAALLQQSSTALLLASTCRQIRRYLTHALTVPRPAEQGKGEPNLPDACEEWSVGTGERRRGVRSVLSVLDDIYQIAQSEAMQAPLVALTVDFESFFKGLADQVRPALSIRGTHMRCEMAADLPTRLVAPESQLRHALERALLSVLGPVQGGEVLVSLRKDYNTPGVPGIEKVVCTVAWSRSESSDAEVDIYARRGMPEGLGYTRLVDVRADREGPLPPLPEEPAGLDVTEEEKVLGFLARRMKGEYQETAFLRDYRSMTLALPLALAGAAGGEAAAQEGVPGAQGDAVETPGQNPAKGTPEHDAESLAEGASSGADAEEWYSRSGSGEEFFPPVAHSLVSDNVPDLETVEALDAAITQGDVAGADAASGRALNILLIDNNMNSRMMFSMFLSDTSHRITEAYDGQAGVEAFNKGSFDIVFLDMDMPLMDGYQVTRIIRALEAENHKTPVPLIGIASYALPEFRERCIRAGCTEFLNRPFTKHALDLVLESFFSQTDKAE